MSIADELRKLDELRRSGAISEEEYARAKAAVIDGTSPNSASEPASPFPLGGASPDEQVRLWAMLLHFSQFAGVLLPLGGLIVPIVLWQVKKSELPEIDEHGKNVVNWIISSLIYLAASIPLALIGIGIPLAMVVAVLMVAFPIVGGIKANSGEVWKYPLSISFFK